MGYSPKGCKELDATEQLTRVAQIIDLSKFRQIMDHLAVWRKMSNLESLSLPTPLCECGGRESLAFLLREDQH